MRPCLSSGGARRAGNPRGNNGEIWAKLDAGTNEYYHRIDRTTIPLARILATSPVAQTRRS